MACVEDVRISLLLAKALSIRALYKQLQQVGLHHPKILWQTGLLRQQRGTTKITETEHMEAKITQRAVPCVILRSSVGNN